MPIDSRERITVIDQQLFSGSLSEVDPTSIALIDFNFSWTYSDTDRAAGTVADLLWTLNASAPDVVAVVTHRSAPAVAGLLGVARTGATFLAVDPVLPPARQAELIRDAGARFVLAPPGWAAPGVTATVLALPSRPTRGIDASDTDPGTDPGTDPAGAPPRHPDDTIAYLVYTSGSTGAPKGVAVSRAGLRTVVDAQRDLLGVGPGARVYQMSTVSFDAFVFELAMALGTGATLVLPGPHAGYPGPAAAARMRETGVTHLVATPTALAAMDPSDLPDLAVVCSAGERCTDAVRDRWRPGRRLLNLYGPAEATIWATWSEIGPATDPAVIGRPIPGVTALVLDQAMAPVPPGGVGELFLAGPTVAAGYHGRPDLTALRFRDLPDGSRAYQTGDSVERCADGTLRFVGRTDHQVKVRGARVEPGEVEHALHGVAGVAEAVAVPYRSTTGALALGAAYVGVLTPAAVAAALRDRLPHWLVPSRLLRLDALPVSATGKVDTRTLADLMTPAGPPPVAEPVEVPPRVEDATPLQEMALGHARDVLGGPDLRLSDGFAEAGGNSMQALELANRVGDAVGTVLDLTDLFASDDIRGWVDAVEAQLADPDGRHDRPPLPPPPDPPFASAGQTEILVAEAYLANSAAYVMAWCEHVTGPFDADRFAAALRDTAQEHEALRTRYRVGAGGVEVVVDPTAGIDEARGTAATLDEAVALVTRAAAVPYRLDTQPPVRLHLTRLDDGGHGGHLVTVMVHHAACDAVGFDRLVHLAWRRYHGDFETDDTAAHDTAAHDRPPTYGQFAAWQREYLAIHGARARQWWRRHLAGARPVRLPGAADRDPVRPLAGRRRPFTLAPTTAARVADLCRRLHTSPFAVFSAAYTLALEPYLDGDDVIGTPVSARGLPAFDRTIGFFVTTLPLRLRLPASGPVRDWLAAWTAECLSTLAHRDLPLPEIARQWPSGAPDGRPSVLLAVNYTQPTPADGRRRIPLDPGPVKFDLIVSLFGGGAGWAGELVHDVVALPVADADALLGRFLAAIDALADDPDAPVAALLGEPVAAAAPIPEFDLDPR